MKLDFRRLPWHAVLSLASLVGVSLGNLALHGLEPTEAVRQNWPQWRGPLADGVGYGDPPIEWGPDKNIKWKTALPGRGSASPIVWQDRVFVLTAIPTERAPTGGGTDNAAPLTGGGLTGSGLTGSGQAGGGRPGGGFGALPAPDKFYQFAVICFDRGTGAQRWMRVATEAVPHEGGHSTNTFASGSPITDGKWLYASFGSHGIFCYDLDGNLKWRQNLGQMRTRNGFGEGSSPALHGDVLIVPWDHEEQSFLAALHAKTGELLWKVDRDEPTTWATPLIVEHGNRTQVVTNGTVRVRSYDLHTGELLWECGGQAANPIPSPVVHENLVYCMTGYRGYAVYALPLDAQGDITDTDKIAWKYTESGPYVSSPVLYKDQLYFTKARDGILSILDARTGDVVIDQMRLPGVSSLYASPVAAADRIYFTSREGTTVVLRHGSALDLLATNQLGEGIDASPAIVGSEMFLRGERHLYCIAAE